ncbi:MAG: hypothetical protein D6718_12025 [Acidobacteria bacterium]|nr:MAG: hypothetical protein D6718_12025 [Acidobacteriota bacterium]
MAFPREPLSAEAFASSALPVWICRVTGDETVADILVFGERRNRFFSRPGPLAAEACGVMAEAVSEAAPRTIRTGRLARVVRRRDVTLEEGSSLEAAFWSDALAELPGAIAFGKREVGDRPTGSILDWKGRTLVAREGRYHGVERTLRAGPAALDLAGRPLWAARWRFETRLERFGAHPSADAVEVSSLLVAAVPIRDPLMDRETASRTPLWVPARELVDRAVRRIDSAAAPGPRQVLEALADPSLWPAAGDWLLVACREDGTARYAIAPAAPEVEVENAGEVCAAAEEVLAPAGR